MTKIYPIKHGNSRFADDLSMPYIDFPYRRTFHGNGLNGAAVDLEPYKGYVLVTIGDAGGANATKEGGVPAWLWGEDFDGLIKLLREAKRVWRRHYDLMRKIRDCSRCRTDRFVTCAQHKRAVAGLKKAAAEATRRSWARP